MEELREEEDAPSLLILSLRVLTVALNSSVWSMLPLERREQSAATTKPVMWEFYG